MPTRPPIHRSKRAKRPDDRPSAYARGYGGKGWQRLRRAVYARDMGKCQDCGRVVGGKARDAHIDHIQPKARGGKDTMGNLQLLCASCHSTKTAAEKGWDAVQSMEAASKGGRDEATLGSTRPTGRDRGRLKG